MMQTNREAFLEFTKGATFVLTVLAVFGLVLVMFSNWEEEPQEKYKVVDHYGTCAVVRYTDDSNRWHYFLDCREVR
jgi:hypothetical protein